MARSRERRRSRSRSPIDEHPRVKRKILLNKWDEGVGGAYIPPAATAPATFSGSALALTAPNQTAAPVINLPTIGEAQQRRVIVGNIAKEKSQAEISASLATAISQSLPKSSDSSNQPVLSVQFLTLSGGLRSVMVDLRTPVAAP